VFVVGEQSHVLCRNTGSTGKETTVYVKNLGYYFCRQHIIFSKNSFFWKTLMYKISTNQRV